MNLPDRAPAGRAHGGSRFDWHQDIQAWPHTDFSPVTAGVYQEECGPEQGPLMAVRGSHRGPLHSMYDGQGRRVLRIPEHEIDTERVTALTGGTGSLVLLNCRIIHGSAPNRSDRSRPLLLIVHSPADSRPYTANPISSPLSGRVVHGEHARWASVDPRGCEVPPDWSAGYSGPWVPRPSRTGRREGRLDRPRDTEQDAGCRLHVDEGQRLLLAGEGGCAARDRRCDRPGAGRARADGPGR